MLKKFNNLKIGKKLTFGFAAVLLILIILSTVVYVTFSNYIASSSMNTHTYQVLTEFDGMLTSMVNMETGQRGFSITGDEKFLEPYNNGKADFDKYWNSAKELTSDNPKQQVNLDKIKQLQEEWQKIAESSINLRRDVVNKNKTMEDVIREEAAAKGKTSMDGLRSVLAESSNIEDVLLEERTNNQNTMETITKLMLILGTIFAILLGITIAYFISRVITQGIKKITDAADKLAVGDMNIDVDLTSQDEIGFLAVSFAKMKDNIRNVIKEVTVLSEKAVDGDLNIRGESNKFNGDYKNIIDGINSTLDAVVQPVKEASNVLIEMAKGNLQICVEGNYKGDHAAMKDGINNTIMAFTDALSDIKSSAEQVATGSKQISDSSIALSQGATEQASSVEELTASLEEISSQTKLNAENANQANGLAENAKLNAIQGNAQMKDMLKAMEEINESSANISKIIKVIDDIAFQTNMLALNAAVEAARAGQHGKGFAVVAEEVKNLAARSANAAKETTEMIEGSIKKSEGGTRIAKDTAEALNKIVNEIEKVANIVNNITVASNEQAAGIEQINQGIMQVSMVIQTNSATSEESAAASEELSSQAEILKEAVNKFKLKQNTKNYGRFDGLNPEVLKMLENMSEKKKIDLYKVEDVAYRTDNAKSKIALSDNEFGKY